MFEYKGVKITWLGHDCFRIEDGRETLVTDPFQLVHSVPADYVLISHEHYDHCSPEDLKKVLKADSVVVAISSCSDELSRMKPKEVKIVKPGDKVTLGIFEIKAVPAYNLNKFNSSGKVFHPKDDGKVGYVIKTPNNITIYHAGDTDLIPEMENLKPDIALLPVSGTYVMTVEEAAKAASRIRPKIAIPMHYGAIVGSVADAEKFKREAPCEVRILEKE